MTEPIARIEAALARLGAEHEPPPGWEARVLAATGVRKRPFLWLWWLTVPLAVVFALLLFVLWGGGSTDKVALDIHFKDDVVVRGGSALEGRLGQTMHVGARTGRYRAVRIYANDKLVAACPGDAACGSDGSLDVVLTSTGRYQIATLTGGAALPDFKGDLDGDLAAARTAGLGVETTSLTVR